MLFVTGKGGVGKTVVAAALAVAAARSGRRVLLSDVDGRGDLADAFGLGSLKYEPTRVSAGRDAVSLDVMTMDTESSLAEYLRLHLRVPLVRRLGPVAATFDFVATAAPGVREILRVGKFAYEVRERHYDLVVVDAPATGHVVGHLAAAEAIHDVVRLGPVRSQTEWMIDILNDAAVTGTVVVATPEEMPVTETGQLQQRLLDETGVHLAAVVANRVPPPPTAAPTDADADQLVQAVGPGANAVVEGARFLERRHQRCDEQLQRLRAIAGESTAYFELAEIDGDDADVVAGLSDALRTP
ncbi:MAG: ArsA family ATPase [Acidimicrobiales bacterium]